MTVTVDKDDHVRGSGPVTILVYGDYECPYTRALELVILQLRRRDSDRFRYVYRYFPLREIHPHAGSSDTRSGIDRCPDAAAAG